MSHVSIYRAATLFALSYNKSMDLYRKGAALDAFANRLGSYYNATEFTRFWLGSSAPGMNSSALAARTLKSIQFLKDSGVGHSLRMDDFRVEPFSPSSAALWVTWRILPENDLESWTWETLYGYRKYLGLKNETDATTDVSDCSATGDLSNSTAPIPEGWWEFTVTDNEIATFGARVPNYLDSYTTYNRL